MKLWRRPGSYVAFIDAASEESILKIASDSEGKLRFSYRLYDSQGNLASDSGEPVELPAGTEIRSADDEQLLFVPVEPGADLLYRLYNRTGKLITCSDGVRTQILAGLRMEGNKPLSGHPPTRPTS